jgi:hypothetical protein
MDQIPNKGPIRHLQPYFIKYFLGQLAHNFPNINKWTSDANIDKATSTSFWEDPAITEFPKNLHSQVQI